MQAQTLSPAGLFGSHVRYVVPLFQRPYVWTRDDQWNPLWEDIRALTEQLMDTAADPYGACRCPRISSGRSSLISSGSRRASSPCDM
ncbi:MAG: DUF262 domain-containing protein [Actinomycetota bacterium]|nr:DUF262 domain-containing protein [Actinomycetota bacterium]